MTITNIAIFAFIQIVSLILTYGLYYLYSNQNHVTKKSILNEIVSNIMNFVIFVWLSKVLLNITLFFQDPMAVLVYPSNAQSFYIAFLLTTILFLIQIRKKKVDLNAFYIGFAFVFLTGSIVSELIQYFWQDNLSSMGYLILIILLLSTLILLEDKMKVQYLMYVLISTYSVGLFILTFIYPFATVFGYIIHPVFIGIFFGMSLLVVYMTNKKISSNQEGVS